MFNNNKGIKAKRLFETKYDLRFTWRFSFYIIYLVTVFYLVSRALVGYYENVYVSGLIWFLFVMSYLFSIFLVNIKEVD